MFILYVSNVCSEGVFENIFKNSSEKPGQQVQKFHRLLIEGMSKFADSLSVISRVPTNSSTSRKLKIPSNEKIDNIEFFYIKPPEIEVIKELYLFISSFIISLKQLVKSKNIQKIVIIDFLYLSVGLGAFLASKVLRVKNVAIVTDIPSYMNYSKSSVKLFFKIKRALYKFLAQKYIEAFDSYILLTSFMNEIVNKKAKPYIIIEGLSDVELRKIEKNIKNREKKIILYAGALHERYGIGKLLKAFQKIQDHQAELWLFGSGDMVDEILQYQAIDNRIKFFGTVENQKLLEIEMQVTLLVNPRPSTEEFSKFSFPSKLIEYMSSGTPVLTTKLPGIPKEYFDYLYFFDDESIDGLKETMERILSLPPEELEKKGTNAKKFILNKKDNISQSKKIIEFIKKNIFKEET